MKMTGPINLEDLSEAWSYADRTSNHTAPEIYAAMQYTKTRNIERHSKTVDEICDRYSLQLNVQRIIIIDKGGQGILQKLPGPNEKLPQPLDIMFFYPKNMESNELAMRGFYAHELGHIAMWDDAAHREYILRRNSIGSNMGLLTVPLHLLRAVMLIPAMIREETRVDQFACSKGYSKEIAEVRRYNPRPRSLAGILNAVNIEIR